MGLSWPTGKGDAPLRAKGWARSGSRRDTCGALVLVMSWWLWAALPARHPHVASVPPRGDSYSFYYLLPCSGPYEPPPFSDEDSEA